MKEQEEDVLNSTTKGKNFAIIAAICLLAVFAYSVYFIVSKLNGPVYSEELGMTLTFSITAGTVIGWIVMFLIPATLFTRNTKAVLCAASAYCLYRLYNLIIAFSASEFLFFLAAAAFVIAVILTIKQNGMISFFWFLPAAFLLVRLIIMYANTFNNQVTANLAGSLLITIIFDVLTLAGFLFAGLWLKAAAKE